MKQNGTRENKILNRVFTGFGGILALSPAVATVTLIAIGIFLFFALLAGILIWPALIRCCSSTDPETQKALSLCIAAAAGLLVSSVINIILAYKMDEYHFSTGLLPAFFINLLACVIGVAVSGLKIVNPAIDALSSSALMSLCVQGLFAVLCCLLPTVTAALLGIAFCAIGNLYYDLRS